MSEHHHHDHVTEQVSDKVLLWTTFVNIGLSVFEFIAGAIAVSVALMADALHNTNDAVALLIAYICIVPGRLFLRKELPGVDQWTYIS